MSSIITVQELTKQFAEVKAVDNLSFSVQRGEVYGFLGQNGAGKSTTIRMLLSLIKPSAGKINIFNKDLFSHRHDILQNIGAIIEKPDHYKYLTAIQNLSLMAQLSGIKPTKQQMMQQLERLGLAERAHSKVKTFSQGMKQRLGIACALIHSPGLIILDEPTNGLDPQGIAEVRQLILHLSREEGKTVFVSSHLLSEIELIADSMLIIDRGKKIAEGKVAELLSPQDTMVNVETTDDEKTRLILQQSGWVGLLSTSQSLQLKMNKNEIPELAKFLVDNQIKILSIHSRHSLEDYFLSLTTGNSNVAAYKN